MAMSLHPRTAHSGKLEERTKTKVIKAAMDMQAVVNEKAERLGIKKPPYELLELIGKGSYGRVFKGKQPNSSRVVAIKVVDVDKADSDVRQANDTVTDFMRETAALRLLKEKRAKNVNVIFDAFSFDTGVWIVSEYCTGGSVSTLMKASNPPGLRENYIIPIARELAEAIWFVHDAGLLHRDIKAANVLISEKGEVQLCDFGVSAMLENKVDKRTTVLGTPWWMPPELAIGLDESVPINVSYGREVDIWAYGCTLYELACGHPPNFKVHPEDLGAQLQKSVPRLEGGQYSQGLRSIISLCLEERPQDRPDIDSVQHHSYLAGTRKTHPTAILKKLVQEYFLWEYQGGQRQSLFMAGGAPAAELPAKQLEDDDWIFSTSDSFDEQLISGATTSFGMELNSNLDEISSPTSNTDSIPTTKARKPHPRQLAHPLERIFDKNDSSNYLADSRGYHFMEPSSDLPLRNATTQPSSIRDTTIDLGEYDSETGMVIIPDLDLNTIKGNNKSRFYQDDDDYFQFDDNNEEATFKRSTKDWSNRPRTQDWKFPTMTSTEQSSDDETTGTAHASDTDQISTGSAARPGLPHMTTEPAGMVFSGTQFASGPAPAPGFPVNQYPPETMSAPVSPPGSMTDLGEMMEPRPATAASSYDGGDSMASSVQGDPFSLERYNGSLVGPEPVTARSAMFDPSTVRPNSHASSHRQSRSVPPDLDVYKSSTSEAYSREPITAHDDQSNNRIISERRQRFLDEVGEDFEFDGSTSESDNDEDGLFVNRGESRMPGWKPGPTHKKYANWNSPNQYLWPQPWGSVPKVEDEGFPATLTPQSMSFFTGYQAHQGLAKEPEILRAQQERRKIGLKERIRDEIEADKPRRKEMIKARAAEKVEEEGTFDMAAADPSEPPSPAGTPSYRAFLPGGDFHIPLPQPISPSALRAGAPKACMDSELDRLLGDWAGALKTFGSAYGIRRNYEQGSKHVGNGSIDAVKA